MLCDGSQYCVKITKQVPEYLYIILYRIFWVLIGVQCNFNKLRSTFLVAATTIYSGKNICCLKACNFTLHNSTHLSGIL